MNCKEMRLLLDAYIDGELSAAEMRALEDHAKACESCREEFGAARLLRDTLAHMDDDVFVPLQAQAAWRSAVRAEAGKKARRKWPRAAYALAAALVLAFGVNFAFDAAKNPQPDLLAAQPMQSDSALLETDGAVRSSAKAGMEDCTVFKKLETTSLADAQAELQLLAEEYSGSFSQMSEDLCRVEILSDDLEAFLKAADHIGAEIYAEFYNEDSSSQAETAIVLLQLCEESA